MSTIRKRGSFVSDEEAADTRAILVAMEQDVAFNTESGYSADTALYPDNTIPFVEKHMHYLRTHAINPQHYVTNLRVITRIR